MPSFSSTLSLMREMVSSLSMSISISLPVSVLTLICGVRVGRAECRPPAPPHRQRLWSEACGSGAAHIHGSRRRRVVELLRACAGRGARDGEAWLRFDSIRASAPLNRPGRGAAARLVPVGVGVPVQPRTRRRAGPRGPQGRAGRSPLVRNSAASFGGTGAALRCRSSAWGNGGSV